MDTVERASAIINQIEQGLLEGRDISDILRGCVALSGLVGAHDLRDWANKELRGYGVNDEVPEYRKVDAVIKVDGVTGNTHVTGQVVAPYQLPKEVQPYIDGTVPFRESIAQLELQSRRSDGDSDSIYMQPSASAYACKLIDEASPNPLQQTSNLYYAIPRSALHGVVDQVKTVASDFVANLRVNLPDLESAPTAATADKAIALAVKGDHARIHVVGATGRATASSSTVTSEADAETRVLTRKQLAWTIVGVGVTLAVAVVGWLL